MPRTFWILSVLLLLPAVASAQYGFRMLTVINPMANVSVSQSGAYSQGYKHYECITFVNVAPKTATKITFDFLHFDAQKTFVGSDTLTRTGTFSSGVPDPGPFNEIDRYTHLHAIGERFDLSNYKNCVAYSFPHEGIAFDVIAVRRVEYEDGTSWEAPPDTASSAAPSPSPSPST